MRVRDVPVEQARRLLDRQALVIQAGRFVHAIAIRSRSVQSTFLEQYGDHPLLPPGTPCHFAVSLDPSRHWRRPWKRSVFASDGTPRFGAFDRSESWPYFEWGMNACVARWSPHHLILHAGTVAFGDDEGVILAGVSGSGKSSLTAALLRHGSRLLSDEFALIRLSDGGLDPLVRPVCLKNDMISRFREAFPLTNFSPPALGERKGIVAHMAPPADAIARMGEAATPRHIVLVRFCEGAETRLCGIGRAETMRRLVPQAFNYRSLGKQGFVLLADLVERCQCYDLVFGDAFEASDELAGVLESRGADEAVATVHDRIDLPVAGVQSGRASRRPPESVETDALARALVCPAGLETLSERQRWQVLGQARATHVRHRLAMVARANVTAGALSEDMAAWLDAAEREWQVCTERSDWELGHVLGVLRPLDVRVILLKGTAYRVLSAPCARGRISDDIDIMVSPEALPRVETALREARWQMAELDECRERYYRRWMHELPTFIHEEYGIKLDLHHNILPRITHARVDPRDLWHASVATSLGEQVRVLCHRDLIIHNAVHLFINGNFSNGLRDMLDFRALVRDAPADGDFWGEFADRVESFGVTRAVQMAFLCASAVWGMAIPAPVATRWCLKRLNRSRVTRALYLRALLPPRHDRFDNVRATCHAVLKHWPPAPWRKTLRPKLEYWLSRSKSSTGR